MSSTSKTIVSVQALRAMAAISVVIVHLNQIWLMLEGHANAQLALYPLASGVDLFFVISGFIMVQSSEELFGKNGSPLVFMSRRLARIVPLYWLTTLIAIPVFSQPITWQRFLSSMLFIPMTNAAGSIAPINGVGWTLNFEMFFYVIFAAMIRWRQLKAISGVCAMLVGLVIFGKFLHPANALLLIWTDPIIIEFGFGVAIAFIYFYGTQLPTLMRLALISSGMVSVWFFATRMPPSGLRFIEWGLPAAAIFAGTVLGPKEKETGSIASLAKMLGDSSYALYLIHPLVGAAVLIGWNHGLNHLPKAGVLAAAFMAAIVISVGIHKYIEAPITSMLRQLIQKPAAICFNS
jgi:exopolysaccharide production protein ExoZ